MNLPRFVIMAVPVGVVLAYVAMQRLTVDEAPNRELVARGGLME